jgi:hypothetical protein
MLAEDFEPLPTEWWHFDAPGWERHAVLDVPLAAVGRADSTGTDGLPAPDPRR